MSIRPRRIPSYRLHKPTGQAVVRLEGHDHYLGKHGTPESQEKYDRLVAEWLVQGQQAVRIAPAGSAVDISVSEMILAFYRHAEKHYRKPDGTPTAELGNLKDALRPLRKLYGSIWARQFGPLALRAVQEEMVKSGLSRTMINARVNRIRRVFKWAVSVELIPPEVHVSLRTVPGLQRGRCDAPEPEPIRPVAPEHIEAVLPFLPRPVRAMVQLQRLTGCRPGEITVMRGCDLTFGVPNWTYRPESHKNAWRGQERIILLGPKAQAVVKEFLKPDLNAYLFNPQDVVEELQARRRAARKTKRTPSELSRRRLARPKVKPGHRYNRRSYRMAIIRACRQAKVPEWTPLQLRHTRATEIRAQFGIEAAQAILGHSKVETSQLYAARDFARANSIMADIG